MILVFGPFLFELLVDGLEHPGAPLDFLLEVLDVLAEPVALAERISNSH